MAWGPFAEGGYDRADFNLDGVVDTNDLALWTANQGRTSAVPRPDVVLTPALRLAPDRRTVLSAESNTLHASGGTGTVHWAFVKNPSGGTLTPIGPTSAVYQAGNLSTNVDVIEAWTTDNLLSRSFMNVIDPSEIAALGKAIIVAGGKSLDDPVWAATDYVADKGFNVLRHRGYSKEIINYLSFDPEQDVDGNNVLDDIDSSTAFTNVAAAFTNWVGNSDKLFVFLANHGSDFAGEGFFRLNEGENLTAVQLDSWLDHIQDTFNTEVTVVLDFCYSGSFLDELVYTGAAQRIVIASTSPNELTYFIAGGAVSFSDIFFSGLLQGLDLEQSFLLAQDAMSAYQNATLDDNGDGVYTEGVDGAASAGQFVGATFIAGKDFPIIGKVLGSQLLTEGTTVTLWADDIDSFYPLERVWSSIIPPSHSPNTNVGIPVVNIPELDLAYDNTLGRHQASFSGFSEQGTYRVNYYAEDIWGSVSPPKQSTVIQAGVDERLVLVAGGPTSDVKWASVNNLARTVYESFRARQLSSEQIFYLSPTNEDADGDGSNDVDQVTAWTNFQYAVTNWTSNATVLTVYLIGEVSNALFRLTETETMTAPALDALLDAFQQSNQVANVVMEFGGSGGYIPALIPPAGRERISIAGTKEGQPVLWDGGGLVSFSSHFMSQIFNGDRIGEAFDKARSSIRRASGRLSQTPLLDDNGNGIAGEKNADGAIAGLRFFGAAFVTGEDSPAIGSVVPSQLISAPTSIVVWAKDVLDVDGISNVWAVITPPDFDGTSSLPETNLLFDAGNNRYQANVALSDPGTYTLTFRARDNKGEISSPVQTSMVGADPYEADDSAAQAGHMDLADIQAGHNFHTASDEDWIRFYGATGINYEINVEQVGTNIDLKLDLYYERPDGTLSNIFLDVDFFGKGAGEIEDTGLNFPVDPTLLEGFYLLRISSADTNAWGIDSDYDVWIVSVTGNGQLIVVAVDKLNSTQSPPGTVASLNNTSNKAFNGATTVTFQNLAAGVHTLRVTTAVGYLPDEDPALPNQVANLNSVLYGNPKRKGIQDQTWQTVVFQFVPFARADGVARDKDTGEWIDGAKIEFTATSGILSGQIFDGYPNLATYETQWFTRADGSFPTNVLLPTVNYNLKLSKAGYSNFNQSAILANPTVGTVSNLGTKLMRPLDANGNQIADWWETLYFGPGSNVVATEDRDQDTHNHREEYLIGTDPTNFSSALQFDELQFGASVTLTWPVSPGRTYRIRTSDSLTSDLWTVTAGPWTAAVGQAELQYTDPATQTNRNYRIEVLVP